MVHTGPPCTPTLYNLTGHSTQYHDNEASSNYFVVFKGKDAPGIYLDWNAANNQTLGAHKNNWKKVPTYAEALEYWNMWCLSLHDHEPVPYKVKGVPGTFGTFDEALAVAAQNFITPAQTKAPFPVPPSSQSCAAISRYLIVSSLMILQMRSLDILPLTRILDIVHMRPSPAMTLYALRTAQEAWPTSPVSESVHTLEQDIQRLEREMLYWKGSAERGRDLLHELGVPFGSSWEEVC
ncbi:hypothetical protein C8R43DRAFT_954988 [Mycena crocata]|nr:hypothetical protein C8R43DRAFT_954988 [Mycena crocata]